MQLACDVQSFSSDDTVNTASQPPDTASPHVFLSDTPRDVIDQSRDHDDVAMATQRTIDFANDNVDDAASTSVARQPAANEDVRMDDIAQTVNGNENDVICMPEAIIDGIQAYSDFIVNNKITNVSII